MIVPSPWRPPHECKWGETVRYALDSNARAFRLCLILVVAAVASCLPPVMVVLIYHFL